MSEELKPCHMCNHEAEYEVLFGMGSARCGDTSCRMSSRPMPVKAWNTRPIEDVLRAKLILAEQQRDSWMDSNARRTEEADNLRAEIKRLQTQLAGRTYCHSDEKVNAELEAVTRERDVMKNLLSVAVCPACDGSGIIPREVMRDTGETDGMGWPIGIVDYMPEPCEFCAVKSQALESEES